MTPPCIEVAKASQVVVLDGGFSTQLSCHVGHVIDGGPLWNARFLQTNPDDVVNTHLDFLRAGADCIITNTYQASPEGFMEHLGLSREQSYELIVRAVHLAKRARTLYLEEFQYYVINDRVPIIVGSVGPYGEHLHDGSEYDGSYADTTSVEESITKKNTHFREAITPEEKLPVALRDDRIGFPVEIAVHVSLLEIEEHRTESLIKSAAYILTYRQRTMREWHRPRIQALIEGGVYLLALETIPCQEEAEMLCDLLKEYPNMKACLSFSCKEDQSIAHGESFQKVAKECWDINPDQLVAVGVNCCAPSYVANLMKGFNDDRPHEPIPLIAYPNSREKYNPQIGWIDRDKCEAVEVFIQEWLELGVRYVGGCCRTYAADVSHIRNQVQCWLDRKGFQAKYQAKEPASVAQ